jgi:anti-sigma factor RsiW
MNSCWQDGDLRAYADGELPSDTLRQIAGHLEICPACNERHQELSERAAWVSALMALSESEPAPSIPRVRPRWWRVAAPLAAAAALAAAFVMLPKHAPVRPTPVAKVVVTPTPVQTAPVVRPVVYRPVPRRPKPSEEFLRLDDDPIETATLVRVSAENGALQADLIIGPDGRAHAIRVVGNR